MASAPEQSEEQSRAEEKLEGALRACAANLLRVIAGAGRPYDLPSQMAEAALAFEAMCDVGAGPRAFDLIKTTLNVSHAARLAALIHRRIDFGGRFGVGMKAVAVLRGVFFTAAWAGTWGTGWRGGAGSQGPDARWFRARRA